MICEFPDEAALGPVRLLPAELAARHTLEAALTGLQRSHRCVQRAVLLMTVLTALVASALGYGTVLVDNFPHNLPRVLFQLLCVLGLGSLISLLAFAGLGACYRDALTQRREQCHWLAPQPTDTWFGPPRARQPTRASTRRRDLAGANARENATPFQES